jgi:hypothetical protein
VLSTLYFATGSLSLSRRTRHANCRTAPQRLRHPPLPLLVHGFWPHHTHTQIFQISAAEPHGITMNEDERTHRRARHAHAKEYRASGAPERTKGTQASGTALDTEYQLPSTSTAQRTAHPAAVSHYQHTKVQLQPKLKFSLRSIQVASISFLATNTARHTANSTTLGSDPYYHTIHLRSSF